MIFKKRSYQLYLFVCSLILLPILFVAALNYLILFRADELQTTSQIAEHLQSEHAIFESGIHDLRRELKLEIIRLRKPKIVVFGSSRALDFRQEFFQKTFACACQALSNLPEGIQFAEEMLKIQTPDIVVFPIDFWWFNKSANIIPRPLVQDKPKLTLQKLFKPLTLVFLGKLTLAEYRDLLFNKNNDLLNVTTHEKSGLLAITRSLGVQYDGSYLNGIRLSEKSYEYNKRWRDTLHNPADYIAKTNRYQPNKTNIAANLEYYKKLLNIFRSHGVKVVSVLPPLAPSIYTEIEKNRAGYEHVFELKALLSEYSDEFYDFHDPGSVGTDICEFEDMHHAGNTAYMRLLLTIIKQNQNSLLRPYVDIDMIVRGVKNFEDMTIAKFEPALYLSAEQDFLDFNCQKN